MRSGTPRIWVAALGALAASLACAALALACHPAAAISLSPNVGSAGSTVTVAGRTFIPGETVQLGWNGSGGAQLGSAVVSPSGTFSTTIQIPQAPADTYTVVAYAPGAPASGAASSFTIPGPERARGDGGQSGSPAPAPPAATPTTGSGPAAPSSGSTSGADSGGADGSGGGATTAGGDRGRSVNPSQASPSRAGVTTLPSGTPVFSDSVTRSAGEERGAGRRAKTSSGRASAAPPAGSAAGDLWSGFASGESPLALGSAGPLAEGSGTLPFPTLALLGLGLSAGLAGVGLAGARRRRAVERMTDR